MGLKLSGNLRSGDGGNVSRLKEQPQALRIPLLYANRLKNKLQGRNSCRMDKSTEQVTPPVINKAKKERERG